MLKAQRAAYVALVGALDVAAIVLAFLVAWALRDSLGDFLLLISNAFNLGLEGMVRHGRTQGSEFYHILLSGHPLVDIKRHIWILLIGIPSWVLFLNMQRGYDAEARRGPRQEFALCAYAGVLGTAALLVFMFMAKIEGVSRLLIGNFWILGTAFLWAERALLLPALQRRGRQPIRNVLVIGNATAAERFAVLLQSRVYSASRLIGYVTDEAPPARIEPDDAETRGIPYIGNLDHLEQVLDSHVIDEVLLVRSQAEALGGDNQSIAQRWGNILELCLQRGRTVSMVDEIVPPVGAKVEATMLGSTPILVLHNTPQNTLALALKNVLDRVVAFFALIALAVPFAIIALAIKLTSPGPILFKQKRVGLNGRLFSFYKFRSMIINAEKFKEEHPELFAEINTMSGPFFKSEDDPRITKVGRFLRKYSLDELPQFWNVLRGDMSLVGPRPPLPREVAQLEPWQRRKLSVKGGLTCLWQVSGRNDIDTDEWMRLDLEYIDNWSLWLDTKLIFQTLKVLIKPRGAS